MCALLLGSVRLCAFRTFQRGNYYLKPVLSRQDVGDTFSPTWNHFYFVVSLDVVIRFILTYRMSSFEWSAKALYIVITIFLHNFANKINLLA